MVRPLLDVHEARLTIVEGVGNGRCVIRGEFGLVDDATSNGRIYSRSVWENNLKRLMPLIKARKVYGEMDHPADGQTKLSRVSHLITDLNIVGDLVIGEAEVLDTENGRNLKAIAKAGGSIGISSRGSGSTTPIENGKEMVDDDYILKTFDMVEDPAADTYLQGVMESKENKDAKTFEQLIKENPMAMEEFRKQVVESVIQDLSPLSEEKAVEEKELKEEIEDKKDEKKSIEVKHTIQQEGFDGSAVSRKLAKELMEAFVKVKSGDPKILDEAREEIRKIRAELEGRLEAYKSMEEAAKKYAKSISTIARKAVCLAAFEESLHGFMNDDCERIRGELAEGIVVSKSADEITDAVLKKVKELGIKSVDEVISGLREENKQLKAELDEAGKVLDDVEERMSKISEQHEEVDKELKVMKDRTNLEAYVESKVYKDTNGPTLRGKILAEAKTREDVDRMLSESREPNKLIEEVKKGNTGRRKQVMDEEFEKTNEPLTEADDDLTSIVGSDSMPLMQRLMGIGKKK